MQGGRWSVERSPCIGGKMERRAQSMHGGVVGSAERESGIPQRCLLK